MPRKSKTNVGIIGLGIIGSRVAANLRTAGFQVYVWNRTPKPSPNFMGSPAEVAQQCDVIQLFVADSVALFEMLEALGASLTEKHTVICSATVDPNTIIEAARLVGTSGAKFLEAPFTGSRDAAEKCALVYYIGGDDETLQRVEPVLKASSKAIVKIGTLGQAATLKIVTNILGAVTVQTLSEACAIVKRSGIDLGVMTRALEHHGVRSGIIDMKLPKIIAQDYEPHFSVKHMFKDVQLAIRAANHFDIDIPAATATAGTLYAGINHGWGDLDFSAVAKFYEQEDEGQIFDATPQAEDNFAGETAGQAEPDSGGSETVDEGAAVASESSQPGDDGSPEGNAGVPDEAPEASPAGEKNGSQTQPSEPEKSRGWFGFRRGK